MSIVKWEKQENVAVLTMTNGENRHNPSFSTAMKAAFDEMMADTDVHALVLASDDPKNWSLGVDVMWMMERFQAKDMEAVSQWLYEMNQVFRFLIMCPFPSIAAITGHAFGNGAMLAGACDFRFMRSDRGYMCLPEVDLNIQFAPSMIQWMKKAMPYHLFIDMKWSGRKVGAVELEKNNVLIKTCDGIESTIQEAIRFGKQFHKPRKTLQEMKKRTYKHITDAMETEDPKYLDPPVFMLTP